MENNQQDKPIKGQMSIEELMTSSEQSATTEQHRIVLKKKDDNYRKRTEVVRELALKANVCAATVYNYAKRLGRFPTVEEIKRGRRRGRPPKYTA